MHVTSRSARTAVPASLSVSTPLTCSGSLAAAGRWRMLPRLAHLILQRARPEKLESQTSRSRGSQSLDAAAFKAQLLEPLGADASSWAAHVGLAAVA